MSHFMFIDTSLSGEHKAEERFFGSTSQCRSTKPGEVDAGLFGPNRNQKSISQPTLQYQYLDIIRRPYSDSPQHLKSHESHHTMEFSSKLFQPEHVLPRLST